MLPGRCFFCLFVLCFLAKKKLPSARSNSHVLLLGSQRLMRQTTRDGNVCDEVIIDHRVLRELHSDLCRTPRILAFSLTQVHHVKLCSILRVGASSLIHSSSSKKTSHGCQKNKFSFSFDIINKVFVELTHPMIHLPFSSVWKPKNRTNI